jgi:type IV secretory pathway TraG/TraD family ATPase VirD4
VGSFSDYREVGLPRWWTDYSQGEFPLGSIEHPRLGEQKGFPFFINWGNLARHVAVIGPAGSGKTYGVLAPWVAAAAQHHIPVVAVDVKGDLQDEVRAAKERFGYAEPRVFRMWDIGNPAASRTWNPLAEIGSVPGKEQTTIAQIAQAFLGDPVANDPNKQFHQLDLKRLQGILTIAHERWHGNAHPKVLYQLVSSQSILAKVRAEISMPVTDADDLCRLKPADYPRDTAMMAMKLAWLNRPDLHEMLSGTGPKRFTIDGFFGGYVDHGPAADALIVGSRISEGEPGKMSAAVMLTLLKARCMSNFSVKAPCLWILDEAGRYADRIGLTEMLSLLRGANSPVVVGLQDVTSLPGDEDARTEALSNCDALVTLRGVSAKTAEYFSQRIGTGDVLTMQTTMERDYQLSHQIQPLVGVGEIQHLPDAFGQHCAMVQLKSVSRNPILIRL